MPVHPTLRTLSRTPGFSLLAIMTMALGIGATSALFSVVDAVILQPLAFPHPERIVALNTSWPAKDKQIPRLTGGDVVDLRSALHSFSALSFYGGGQMGVRLRDEARFADTFQVDPAFFHALHVTAAAGRLPQQADEGHTAVLTKSFASANWGDSAKALGQTVMVDNKPYRVIGLLEDKLAFPEKAEVWITGSSTPDNLNRTAYNYRAIASFQPGVTLAQGQAELSTVGTRLAAAYPDSNQGKTFRAEPLQDQLTAPVRTTLLFLLGAAGLLLLISCANVANLMLARAAGRTREIAIRASLGSSAVRIIWLLLAESAVLGIAASAVGLFLAYLAVRLFFPLIPASVPHAADALHLNASVLLFAVTVSCLTVMACSLIPALHLRELDLAVVLKQSAGHALAGGASRSRQLIVVAQIAVCCILCVGAALLARSLLALLHTPTGYRSEGILIMHADAPAFELPEYLQAIRTFGTALDEIQHIPGVQSAAAVMGLPTGRYGSNGNYMVEGAQIRAGQDPTKMNWPQDLPWALFSLASPRYFSTIGIRLVDGRDFTARDQYEAPFTAIISQSLARQSFGTANPIGRRIYCGLDSPKPMTIVGVVSDVRQDSPASKPDPELYMPFQQHPYFANELQIAIRTQGDAARLAPEVRRRMFKLAPYVATQFSTFNEMVRDSISAPRFRTALIAVFAMLAVALAMTGIYGVMTYWVSERSAEMGLRMALGADRTSIIGLVSRQALWLAVTGLTVGIGGALALSRAAESLLYGVRALDFPAYCIGAGMVLVVVMAAAVVPSLRASRVDPAVALRQ
jgi:putative ABC transport system permease protein